MEPAARPFENKIDVDTPRKFNAEFACAGLFYAAIFGQAIMGIIVFASKNSEMPMFEDGDMKCPGDMRLAIECAGDDGWRLLRDNHVTCLNEALCSEVAELAGARRLTMADPVEEVVAMDQFRRLAMEEGPATPGRELLRYNAKRRLNGESPIPENVWAFLEEHAYQPIVLFGSVIVFSGLWMLALQKVTKVVVWGTIIADVILLAVLSIWSFVELEAINVATIGGCVLTIIGAIVLRQKINATCTIFEVAMLGMSENLHLFGVAGIVQAIWCGYFALWIASLISMQFAKTVVWMEADESNSAGISLPVATMFGNQLTQLWWMLAYYWTTWFARNVNLAMITACLGGWYFEQEGSSKFWLPALKWSLGPQGGGNAIASFMCGLSQYLLSRVGSCWSLAFSVLVPFHWIGLCLALCLKTIMQTYTKFGMIAMIMSGRPFCGGAVQAFTLLKTQLGEAMLTDYLGSRILAVMTYVLAVGVAFAAWGWAEHAQGVAGLSSIDATTLIGIIIFYCAILANPLLVMVFVVMVSQYLVPILNAAGSPEMSAIVNAILASLFMGSITLYLLRFVSQLVVSACDVIFFCFAIEADLQKKQDRFSALYDGIKATIVDGTVQNNDGVVMGKPPGADTAGAPAPATNESPEAV